MPKGYKVAPVEGRTIVDPFHTVHSAIRANVPQRRIGYTRHVDAENLVVDPRSGQKVPRESWKFHGKEEVVTETTDGFYRRAIREGDLDYLASVEIGADGTTKPLPLDRELLVATAVNQAKRAHAAKLAEQAQADAAKADEDAKAFAEKAGAEALAALERSVAKPTPATSTTASTEAPTTAEEPAPATTATEPAAPATDSHPTPPSAA